MTKTILLINKNAVLITCRLIPLLESSKVECVSVEPDLEKVTREKDSVDLFMLLAGEFVNASKDFLASFKDVCSIANKPLCVMGHDKELEA